MKKNLNGSRIGVVCNLLFVVVAVAFGAFYLKKADEETKMMADQAKSISLMQDDLEQFVEGTNYLTQQAKCYVVNGRTVHMFNYFKEVNDRQNREKALKQLKYDGGSEKELDYMHYSYEKSNELIDHEMHAMKLLTIANRIPLENIPVEIKQYEIAGSELLLSREAMKELSRELLYGRDYEAKKEDITRKIKISSDLILSRTQDDMRLQSAKLELEIFRIKLILVITIGMEIVFATILFFQVGEKKEKEDLPKGEQKIRGNRPLNKGFTLAELLVVVVILVAILGVIIPTYYKYIGKSKDVKNLEAATTYKKIIDHVMVDAVMGDFGEFQPYDSQLFYQAFSTRIEKPSDGPYSKIIKSISEQMVTGKNYFEVIARIQDYRVTQVTYKDLRMNKIYVWYIDTPAGNKLQEESFLAQRDEWMVLECENEQTWVSDYTLIQDGNVCWNGYENPEEHLE